MRLPRPTVSATVLLAGLVLLAGCSSPAPSRTAARTQPATSSSASAPPIVAAAGSTPRVSPQPTPGIDLTAFSTTDPASPWVVVNKTHPLRPATYTPGDLVIVRGYSIRSIAAGDLTALLAAATADGVKLTLRSTYRSYATQRTVYGGLVAQDGQGPADRISARPGFSEHQTGLAIDFGSSSDSACDFEDCFGTTAEGRWLATNAHDFGFIVRYTADNQAITGYAPEPWHVRYVGRPLAAAMAATAVTTLEQVFGVDGGTEYR